MKFEPTGNTVLVKIDESSEQTTAGGIILKTANVEITYEVVKISKAVKDLPESVKEGSKCEIKAAMCTPLIMGGVKYFVCPMNAFLGVYND